MTPRNTLLPFFHKRKTKNLQVESKTQDLKRPLKINKPSTKIKCEKLAVLYLFISVFHRLRKLSSWINCGQKCPRMHCESCHHVQEALPHEAPRATCSAICLLGHHLLGQWWRTFLESSVIQIPHCGTRAIGLTPLFYSLMSPPTALS